MSDEQRHEEYTALLVAEVGTAWTRVALVDGVADTYRLVARAEAWSTHQLPQHDVMAGILQAVAVIAETSGRELVRNGQLLQPMDADGNGVSALVVTTSIGGVLPVLVFALSAARSARSASHAARATYTQVIRNFALDEAGGESSDWLNRQIVQLAQSHPGAIVIAGGLDGGAAAPLQRLAEIVRLVCRQQTDMPAIIFAGNPDAAPAVQRMLDGLPLTVVENLRPGEGRERLEPTRYALRRVYAERRLNALPGGAALHRGVANVSSVAEDQGVMTRFLAERFNRNILTLDMGATTLAVLLQSNGHYSESIWGNGGTQAGALDVLNAVGADAITRWLPYELTAAELEQRLLNRRLLPPHVPADLDALLLDHALLREGLRLAYHALRDERPDAPVDFVLAAGALTRAPRPGLALLSLLDTLELNGATLPLVVDVYLDTLSLLAASGALARVNADAGACLMEQDGLNNGPLATVIVPHGRLEGQVCEIELTPVGGEPLRAVVEAGTLVRMPLPRGRRATLRIRPAAGVAIGANAAGAEVSSNEAAIAGSAVGVVIDARLRPLVLPVVFAERQRVLLGHLHALDALPSANAYQFASVDAAVPDDQLVLFAPNDPTPPASVTVDTDTAPSSETDDVASMRQDLVDTPAPKRGFFRRK